MMNHRVDGRAIRSRRVLKGFGSGAALGRAVGVSGQHMLRIEREMREPSAEVYSRLLDVLGGEEGDFLKPQQPAEVA